jgi:heptaprenyl diphosphate synthase
VVRELSRLHHSRLTHQATLYHDDVMDEAIMRRGRMSPNSRWDNAVAILTGA